MKIRLLKPHGKKQTGHVFVHDYHEPLAIELAGGKPADRVPPQFAREVGEHFGQ